MHDKKGFKPKQKQKQTNIRRGVDPLKLTALCDQNIALGYLKDIEQCDLLKDKCLQHNLGSNPGSKKIQNYFDTPPSAEDIKALEFCASLGKKCDSEAEKQAIQGQNKCDQESKHLTANAVLLAVVLAALVSFAWRGSYRGRRLANQDKNDRTL